MKTVLPITDGAIRETLGIASCHGPTLYVRERAHAVLLSSRGFSMAQIADIFEVQYQAVSRWLDNWEDYGIRELYKTHGGGKKPIYNAAEEQRINAIDPLLGYRIV